MKTVTFDGLALVKSRTIGSSCPLNTYGCQGSTCYNDRNCFCEPHCSWEKCRLFEKPEDCLNGVNSEWIWNSTHNFWVAQLKGIVCSKIMSKYILQIGVY